MTIRLANLCEARGYLKGYKYGDYEISAPLIEERASHKCGIAPDNLLEYDYENLARKYVDKAVQMGYNGVLLGMRERADLVLHVGKLALEAGPGIYVRVHTGVYDEKGRVFANEFRGIVEIDGGRCVS